jgi:hypothetical protein
MSTVKIVFHPGTGTYMNMDECIMVNVPVEVFTEDEDVENYLKEQVI